MNKIGQRSYWCLQGIASFPLTPVKIPELNYTPSLPAFAVVKSNTCVVILYVCAS